MKKIPVGKRDFALVDDEDFKWLSQWRWTLWTNGPYAARKVTVSTNKRVVVYMHRLLNKTPEGKVTDHRNGNGLDNRRENLRAVTPQQNMMNRRKLKNGHSKFKGVTWHIRHKAWMATIKKEGKTFFLGYFAKEKDAVRKRQSFEKELFGEFAYASSSKAKE